MSRVRRLEKDQSASSVSKLRPRRRANRKMSSVRDVTSTRNTSVTVSAIVPNIVPSAAFSCDVDSADVIVEPAFQAVTETVTIVTDEEVGVAFDGSEFVNEVEVSSQDEQEEEDEVVDGAWIPPEVRVTVAQRLPLFPSALDPSSQMDYYFSSIDDNMSGLLDL